MRLVKRVITSEDHLGIETGPLDQEQISISGVHKDVADGSFRQTLGSGNPIWWYIGNLENKFQKFIVVVKAIIITIKRI